MNAPQIDLANLLSAGASSGETRVPMPLPPELLPVPPFPVNALPDALRPMVEDVVELMNCPPDYVAMPALVGAASLVARKGLAIRPKALDCDWTVVPNLWGLIVGPPGAMKTPALKHALAPLNHLEAKAYQQFQADCKQHRVEAIAAEMREKAVRKQIEDRLKKDATADIAPLLMSVVELEQIPRPRYILNDATYEKLGEVLVQNPGGVLVVRDEMRGFLQHLGREEQVVARAFFLTGWSGGGYTFDRIGRGTISIPDVRISMIGAIQPGPLQSLIRQAQGGAIDDGLVQRFLISHPDIPRDWKYVDREPNTKARRAMTEAFRRLDTMSAAGMAAQQDRGFDGEPTGPHILRFDAAAQELFVEWHSEFERGMPNEEAPIFEAVLAKFRHHMPALALTLHALDGGIGPVGRVAALRAFELTDYFVEHARRAHGGGRSATVRAAKALMEKLRRGLLEAPFTVRGVHTKGWTGLATATEAQDAVDLLCASGWLLEQDVRHGSAGGRPTTIYMPVPMQGDAQ